jgi:hypothetical protein
MTWTKTDCDRAGCSLIFEDLDLIKDAKHLEDMIWKCKGCGKLWKYDGCIWEPEKR